MKNFLFIFCIVLASCNSTPQSEQKNEHAQSAEQKDSITQTAATLQSEITCPKCGHKKTETMPTDQCLIKYTCEKCKADIFPKVGDCCVFCSYGSVKCPSKQ